MSITQIPKKTKIWDGTYDAGVDSLNYLVAIEIEHHKVHAGTFFTVTDYDADVDIAAPKYWHIIAPDSTTRVHIKIAVATDTAGLLEFFENPTTTGNGTAITAYNNDRNSGTAATSTYFYDPTTSSDGTKIENFRVGAGSKQKIGGDARQSAEIILKQAEQYLVKFTPDANDAEVTFNAQFYEV